MNFMETMEKMNSIDDVQLKKDWGYTDIQLFSLNEGVFAARKEWQKDPALKCKSVFLSKFTNDEGYRYDQENDTAADILVTGVQTCALPISQRRLTLKGKLIYI